MPRPVAVILAFAAISCGPVFSQQKAEKPESPAKLELSMDIAATDDDGYPSALRITITNVGDVPVDLPFKEACSPDNGFEIHSVWFPDVAGKGAGSGRFCGTADGPSLMSRIQHEWVRLRPGEFMTQTQRVDWTDYREDGSGTVVYWVEYTPPSVSKEEIAKLAQAGYIIPTEQLRTPRSSFQLY